MSAAAPQTFVEKAQQAAAAAPILPGDDQALALLQDARQHIYHWPARFAGFQARLRVADQHWTLIAPNSRSFRIEPQLEKTDELFGWTHYHLGEILSHREHPKVHQMASKTGVLWGDWDDTYGRRLDFAGDKMSSFYRIKDQRIQQISRRYGGQHFLICIDRHHRFAGRWAAATTSPTTGTPRASWPKSRVITMILCASAASGCPACAASQWWKEIRPGTAAWS